MSDSLVQLQQLKGLRVPPWFTSNNRLFDDARESFSNGELIWNQATGWLARLFNDLWAPDFAVAATTSTIPGTAWVAPAVALQNVERDRGYCKASGVLFPSVISARPLTGVAIYNPAGRVIFAATDYFGNLPVLQQNVFVQWDTSFNGPFRI